MRVYVVVPALNEAGNLRVVLPQLADTVRQLGHSFAVCVVDDGSTDDTVAVCQRLGRHLPIVVRSHGRNLGVHAAFKTGFAWALSQATDEDAVMTMEADNTADLRILPTMLERLTAGADLVLASCYAPGGAVLGTTVGRRILSHCANLMLRFAFSLHGIHTYSAFYRVYRASLLHEAHRVYGEDFIACRGFVCMVEVLVKLHALTHAIVEVPTVLRADRRVGRSKMRVLKTTWGYVRFVWRAKAGGKGNR